MIFFTMASFRYCSTVATAPITTEVTHWTSYCTLRNFAIQNWTLTTN